MHHINSSICKRKEKKKARITQLETYKYEGILSNRGRIDYLQEEGRKNKRVIRSLVEERVKKERLFCLILYLSSYLVFVTLRV